MKTHIRHIARRRKGVVTENEKIIERESITIGRATDQDIYLADSAVSYQHARINILPNGSIAMTSLSQLGFYHDDKLVQNCRIRRAGVVILGSFRITFQINTRENQVDITIEKFAMDIVEVQAAKTRPTRLEQTWMSKRQMSWLGFAIVIILFLGIPMLAFHEPQVDQMVQDFQLPDDDVWLSGDISAPHRYFGDDCNQCHQQPFVKVQNEACIACHRDTKDHAERDKFFLPALHQTRCASCHREHNGSEHLVQTDQNLCSDCHRSLSLQVATSLDNIGDFYSNHPEFKASLVIHQGLSKSEDEAWQRVSLDSNPVRHETGILFPHDLHLDANGIRGPSGKQTLNCDSCHQTDSSGNYMRPIKMENHCQSCHRLEFDPDDMERELPHSDLKNLKKMLQEYFSMMALKGNNEYPQAPDLINQRRRPGKSLTADEQGVALEWAMQKAEKVTEEVIEFRSCNLCHKVTRDSSSELGWIIPEVIVSQKRWLPKSAFTHDTHRITGCNTCHNASASSLSEDVLLPRIQVCRECHGGQLVEDRLQSTCIDCHQFHQPDELPMESGMPNHGIEPNG